jgi:hypothetical protein
MVAGGNEYGAFKAVPFLVVVTLSGRRKGRTPSNSCSRMGLADADTSFLNRARARRDTLAPVQAGSLPGLSATSGSQSALPAHRL